MGHERPSGRCRHVASFTLYVVGVCINRIGTDQSYIAREIKKNRTTYSDILNRTATPFEAAYIEFSHQCAVADFMKVKRPKPPAIFSEKYTNEQMSDFLEMIPKNKFYRAHIQKLRYES